MAESTESEDEHEKNAPARPILDAVVLRAVRFVGHIPGALLAQWNDRFQGSLLQCAMPVTTQIGRAHV